MVSACLSLFCVANLWMSLYMARGFLVWSGKDSGNASFWENGCGALFGGNLDVFLWWWVLFGGGGGGGGGLWVRIRGDFVEALVLKWRRLLLKGFEGKT
jgi:hypothetical protein